MNFKGVIFDMDGTLIDSLGFWEVLWKKLGEKYLNDKNFRPTDTDEKCVRTMTLEGAMNLIHKNYGIGKTHFEISDFARDLLEWFYKETVKLKDGAYEYLEYLERIGIKMCIASATKPELIKLALDNCKIKKFFQEIISCEDVGKGKDEPDVFLEALKYLGTELSQTVVIDDSLTAIKTSEKAGFLTVGVYDKNNFGHEEMKKIADEFVDNGESLLKLIK